MTHSQFHDLTVGCYRPGQFYSEAICGVPWEQDFLFPGGVGREDCCGLQHTINGNIHESIIIQPWGLPAEAGTSRGGPEKTRRLIILLHETSHLLHDLSLGVCMVLDSILDITSAMVLDCVKSLSLEKEIQCPLLSDGSSPRWVHTPQISTLLRTVQEMESLVHGMIQEAVPLTPDITGILRTNRRAVGKDIPSHISGLWLLESLVATKTLLALVARVKDYDDAMYLGSHKEELSILPEDLPPQYSSARELFHAVFSQVLGFTVQPTSFYWPHDYAHSLIRSADIFFIIVADMALHIPPYLHMRDRIEKGSNSWEDFHPGRRFSQALSTILRERTAALSHFAARKPNYEALFDWIAMNQHPAWPTLQETNGMWKQLTGFMKLTRQEASDGYRFRTLVERHERWFDLVVGDSLLSCWRLWIPVFHLTPTGMKVLCVKQIADRLHISQIETPNTEVFDIFHRNYGHWADASADNDISAQANNELSFRQEVIYRSICRELHRAWLYCSFMACPLAGKGCRAAMECCHKLTSLAIIPHEGCCLREYLNQDKVDPSKIVWPQREPREGN